MKCPECGSNNYRYSVAFPELMICLDCEEYFVKPIGDDEISRKEGDGHIG